MLVNFTRALYLSKQFRNNNFLALGYLNWYDWEKDPILVSRALIDRSWEGYGYGLYSFLNFSTANSIYNDAIIYPDNIPSPQLTTDFRIGFNKILSFLPMALIDGFVLHLTPVVYENRIVIALLRGQELQMMKVSTLLAMSKPYIRVYSGKKGKEQAVEVRFYLIGYGNGDKFYIPLKPNNIAKANQYGFSEVVNDCVWYPYVPSIAGQNVDIRIYEPYFPTHEGITNFINLLRQYNKPVYVAVSLVPLDDPEFNHTRKRLEGHLAFQMQYAITIGLGDLANYLNTLPVDGVILEENYSQDSWIPVGGDLATYINDKAKDLFSLINGQKIYVVDYTSAKFLDVSQNQVQITQSHNSLFNSLSSSQKGVIYTPPVIDCKNHITIMEAYTFDKCEHAWFYTRLDNVPYDLESCSRTSINPDDLMNVNPYKPPQNLLQNCDYVVAKQVYFEPLIGVYRFIDKVPEASFKQSYGELNIFYQIAYFNRLAESLSDKTIIWQTIYTTPLEQVFRDDDFYSQFWAYDYIWYFVNFDYTEPPEDIRKASCLLSKTIRNPYAPVMQPFIPIIGIPSPNNDVNSNELPFPISQSVLLPFNYASSKFQSTLPFLFTNKKHKVRTTKLLPDTLYFLYETQGHGGVGYIKPVITMQARPHGSLYAFSRLGVGLLISGIPKEALINNKIELHTISGLSKQTIDFVYRVLRIQDPAIYPYNLRLVLTNRM